MDMHRLAVKFLEKRAGVDLVETVDGGKSVNPVRAQNLAFVIHNMSYI